MAEYELSKEEISFIKKLNTPEKIQRFIDSLKYNTEKRISIMDVLKKRKADCLEAAAFASIVFAINGYKTFIMDLEAYRDDDHVICVFKKGGLYGAVAQSKYLGLKYKSPVYINLRELSMSYFEHYFDYNGKLTLKNRSVPLRLPKKIGRWAYDRKFVHKLELRLQKIRHLKLVPKKIELAQVSAEVFKRETLLLPKNSKVAKKYIGVVKGIKKIPK